MVSALAFNEIDNSDGGADVNPRVLGPFQHIYGYELPGAFAADVNPRVSGPFQGPIAC